MPNELVVPGLAPCSRLDTNETVAVEAIAGAVPPIIVVSRCADRQIHATQLFICAHRRPAFHPRAIFPGRNALPLVFATPPMGNTTMDPCEVSRSTEAVLVHRDSGGRSTQFHRDLLPGGGRLT